MINLGKGNIIWLTGLESFQSIKFEEVPFVEPSATTAFIQKEQECRDEEDVFSTLYAYILENADEVNIQKRGAVIDASIKGVKTRFIIDKLSPEEINKFVIEENEGRNIIITSRPNGITKTCIENKISEQGRLMINLPMPKPANLDNLLKTGSRWTRQCFNKTMRQIASQMAVSMVADLLCDLAKYLVQNIIK